MSSFNLRTTVNKFINNLQQTRAWGLILTFEKPYAVNGVTKFLTGVEGVREVEAFWYVQADIINAAGEKQLSLPLTCVEPKTKMLKYPYLEGHWLTGKSGEIIVNQSVANRMPDLKIGDELRLKIDNVSKSYHIAGIIKSPNREAGFIDYHEYVSLSRQKGLANGFYVNGTNHDQDYLQQLKHKVEKNLMTNDFEVAGLATAWQGFESLKAHFDIVFVLIFVVTLLLILVGGNCLILGMRASLLERTHEIGVIKAIGASKKLLYKILISEGVVIGLLSWLLAVVLTIPISYLFAIGVGQAFFQSPLPSTFSITGVVICLLGTVAVAALSCFFPARSTANLSVREALFYE